jgi:cytochrome c-type biogenesis protein CcsB
LRAMPATAATEGLPEREKLGALTRLCVSGLVLLLMTFAITRPAAEQAINPLLPALRSAWLQVHVLSALVSYGAFGVAAGMALAQLIWSSKTQPDENVGTDPRVCPGHSLCSQGVAPTRNGHFRHGEFLWAVRWGLLWLTLSMLSGAIWAQAAWGRYWGWDPKESWALVTWLFYLLILHARSLPAWRGRRLAVLVVAGLGVVMFTFVGVPWLVRTVRLESLHGF